MSMVFSCLCCCHSSLVHRNNFFRLFQKDKSFKFRVKFRQTSNHCKRVLEAANLHMLIKQESLSLRRNLALGTFGKLLIVFSTKVNLLYPLCSTAGRFCLQHQIKHENFPKNSNLDDSGISLPVFPSRTNLKLHNISVTPKMVRKVVMNLDLSKASGPDCISVVVLKNYEPEFSYIIAELFNKCLKESCFLDFWKVSLVVPVSKNVGLQLKTTALLVFILRLVKSLKNL